MKINIKAIKDFIQTWQNSGSEVADKVTYWNSLLEILGVPKTQIDNKTYIEYEKPIKLNKNQKFRGSIDAYIPSTKVLIEQKSNGVDLSKPEERPNGGSTEKITPFEQAKRYNDNLGSNERADFLVLSNFSQIIFYDIRESYDVDPVTIDIKDLEKNLYLLNFLVKRDTSKQLKKEKQISIDAGNLVRKIYNELFNIFKQYDQAETDQIKHSINTLCVRLVFCLYAEDADLFDEKEQFYNYLEPFAPNRCGIALKNLFKVLNTPETDRTKEDPFWETENPVLAKFRYVNGGLFADENIIIPPFTPELKEIVLEEASRQFDWSSISPTIFGAVFESTLNPETRREGGMHYTSIENIHKVIDPLFLDDLKQELEDIKQYKNQSTIKRKAIEFQEKLSNLTFFDPACGSGNFLTETFLSLRRLENEAIRLETNGESVLDVGQAEDWIHVSIQQFYGIEINDFAVSVAKTALWIAENQMMKETQNLIYAPGWNFLPLHTYTKIHEADALKMDWNKVIPNYACHYTISNPPFVGARRMSREQKNELKDVSDNIKGVGNLDYVSGWYFKLAKYIQNTKIEACFVSTNSIVQGNQVAILWQPLLKKYKLHINFAYQSFKWDSEAKIKAHVHVVIISLSSNEWKDKILFDTQGIPKKVNHIDNYLIDAPDIFIESRKEPISAKQKMGYGSFALDDGNYTLSADEYKELDDQYHISEYVKPFIGAKELIHNQKRYCIWLKDMSPTKIRANSEILRRVENVKKWRSKSKRKNTQELAYTPTLFAEIRQPDSNYMALPITSSKRREYIPIGFLDKNVIASNKILIIPNSTTYEFGILESIVHMAWTRVVSGRLKGDYSYSSLVVYNNFPFPSPDNKQKEEIEKTAQAILDARNNYPESSLADLYDPTVMPPDLRKAHRNNDKAVLQAYGLPIDATESEILTHLFKMYEKLTDQSK